MKNLLYVGTKIFCKDLSYGVVESIFETGIVVSFDNVFNTYKYDDVGRKLFFEMPHVNMSNEALSHFREYVYFQPDIKNIYEELLKIQLEENLRLKNKSNELKEKDLIAFRKNLSNQNKSNAKKVYYEELDNINETLNFINIKIDKLSITYDECVEDTKLTYSPNAYEMIEIRNNRRKSIILSNEITEFKEIKSSPYFARMDFIIKEKNLSEPFIMYIGKRDLYNSNGTTYVYDWRNPIRNKYYFKNTTKFNLDSDEYELCLRRAIEIENSKLTSFNDEYIINNKMANNGITDPFLIQILKGKRNQKRLTDIIKTIQSNQNDLVTALYNCNFIVQGCAGSGKTMILLHRLSYLLYNDKNINIDKIKIITPNDIFNDQIDELSRELEIDKIEKTTLEDYYTSLLSLYKVDSKPYIKLNHEKDADNNFVNYVYSDHFINKVRKYIGDWLDKIIDLVEKSNLYNIAAANNIKVFRKGHYKDRISEINNLIYAIINKQDVILTAITKDEDKLFYLRNHKDNGNINFNEPKTLAEVNECKNKIPQNISQKKSETNKLIKISVDLNNDILKAKNVYESNKTIKKQK